MVVNLSFSSRRDFFSIFLLRWFCQYRWDHFRLCWVCWWFSTFLKIYWRRGVILIFMIFFTWTSWHLPSSCWLFLCVRFWLFCCIYCWMIRGVVWDGCCFCGWVRVLRDGSWIWGWGVVDDFILLFFWLRSACLIRFYGFLLFCRHLISF